MAFEDEGFRSPDLASWIATTRSRFEDWFDLVDSFNQEAMKILLAIKPSQSENQQLVASLLYRRALQSFQGAVLMAERGMIVDALTLVRSCAETAIAIGSVAGDEKFVDVLVEANDEAILTYSNVLLNDPESRQFFTPEQLNNLKQTVAEIRSKYSGSGPRRIKWAQAAINAKMTALTCSTFGDFRQSSITTKSATRRSRPNPLLFQRRISVIRPLTAMLALESEKPISSIMSEQTWFEIVGTRLQDQSKDNDPFAL